MHTVNMRVHIICLHLNSNELVEAINISTQHWIFICSLKQQSHLSYILFGEFDVPDVYIIYHQGDKSAGLCIVLRPGEWERSRKNRHETFWESVPSWTPNQVSWNQYQGRVDLKNQTGVWVPWNGHMYCRPWRQHSEIAKVPVQRFYGQGTVNWL